MDELLLQMLKVWGSMGGAILYGVGFHMFVYEMLNKENEQRQNGQRFWTSVAFIMVGLPLTTLVGYGFLFAIVAMLLPTMKERFRREKEEPKKTP